MTASISRSSSDLARSMREHYGGDDDAKNAHLIGSVMKAVDAMGPGLLSASQLANLDQFHVRGLVATAELAQLTGLDRSSRVLDAGSGLGGPARFLAETYGCRVTGVDLSPVFVELSHELSRRSPVADLVRFEVADLCALPFGDGGFDRVWTQHVMMNVHERSKAYAEFHRVLSTDGRLAFYDVVAADERPDLVYPVPWASRHELSHLLTRAETEAALLKAGFVRRAWNDVTALAMNWFGQAPVVPHASLNLATVMGSGLPEMVGNLSLNLRQGRIRLAMGVFERAS
jgi:ubiquinone/menaquinone biosynthesis C-methylase UbiE